VLAPRFRATIIFVSIRRIALALAFAFGFVIAGSSSADAQVWKIKKKNGGGASAATPTAKKAKPAAARTQPVKKKTPARKQPKRKLDLTGDAAPDEDAPPPDRSDRQERFTRSEDDDPVEVTVEELDD
jgi:hypothetical protein